MATIILDTSISSWDFSKQLFRLLLDKYDINEDITFKISSLGGDLDHALAIHDTIAERGKISCQLYGFIASAATLIALPAKTRISTNAFYLIHKVLTWVDEWGMMNEDDLEEVIKRLEKEKRTLEKMTLQIASMYLKRAKSKGKTLQDVLSLMKEDRWMTAKEACDEWGFVDEVYDPEKIKETKENHKQMNTIMFNAIGLPIPPTFVNPNNNTMNPKTIKLNEINRILGIEELVIDTEGSFIQEQQLVEINNTLQTQSQTITDLNLQIQQSEHHNQTLQQHLNDATASAQSMQETIAQHENAINERQNTIDQLQQQIDEMKERLLNIPAKRAITIYTDGDKSDNVDWQTINQLPHNQGIN